MAGLVRLVALGLLVLLPLGRPLPVAAAPAENADAAGHFFAQSAYGVGAGFGVRDEGLDGAGNTVRMWSEFQRFGGLEGLGYPISRRFVGAGNYTYQVFQRGVLQWRPERMGAALANTFDWLNEAGRDPMLDRLGVPPPVADDGSGGDWLKAKATRLTWLTEAAIKDKLVAAPGGSGRWSVDNAFQFYGLPTSRPEKRGPFVIQRFQRVSFQLWVENVPGMPPVGSVVGVLGGEMLREAGVIPAEALAPEYLLDAPKRSGEIRGVFVSGAAAATKAYRDYIFDLADKTEVNAVVLDIKGDRGLLSFGSALPLARGIGVAARPIVSDFASLVESLHQRRVYVIGRVAVFKDEALATARPSLAVTDTKTGGLWRDKGGVAWADPFREDVWNYNIGLAQEAARLGVDEIQFDYIRFPGDSSNGGARFAQAGTPTERVSAVVGFLARARAQLQPLGVKVSADLFGDTAWRPLEATIGQNMELMARHLDVVSPMLYPSTFGDGPPGYRPPVAYPYEIVLQSVQRARDRLKGMPVEVRPWLQDFPDYAFDKRPFGAKEVGAQIRGARDGGASGWLLWNSSIRYTREALAGK